MWFRLTVELPTYKGCWAINYKGERIITRVQANRDLGGPDLLANRKLPYKHKPEQRSIVVAKKALNKKELKALGLTNQIKEAA